jgi:hypothetical protein
MLVVVSLDVNLQLQVGGVSSFPQAVFTCDISFVVCSYTCAKSVFSIYAFNSLEM